MGDPDSVYAELGDAPEFPSQQQDDLEELSRALDKLEVTQAQLRGCEANTRKAVELANRELRKRQEAYAKLDILMAEYRYLAQALADLVMEADRDQIETVTSAFLERLSLETSKLEPGDSGGQADAVGPGLAAGGAGSSPQP
jgi:hypothetical protein